eukprot:Protomagalhaensia_wolfi_Nauph_80__1535@NODE_1937_length_1272_cov_6_115977_g1516_i0_p1_GENE_NODE_1937_length_1272_cov_6_115977_g1516_i0NODE_1937_length_1272_cov_6_115977_g1516_i0_p1_ORF_typecomplete_len356_score54_31DUF2085/PF09858_9/0_094DUF2085/PF09858_9/3_5e03_NODE_1937_length_1272_cov_6_115977_g1516_i01221189
MWQFIIINGVIIYWSLQQRRLFLSLLKQKLLPTTVNVRRIWLCDAVTDVSVALCYLTVGILWALRTRDGSFPWWTYTAGAAPFLLEAAQMAFGILHNMNVRRQVASEVEGVSDSKVSEAEGFANATKQLLMDHFKHTLHPFPHKASLIAVMSMTALACVSAPSSWIEFLMCLAACLRLPTSWTAPSHSISNCNVAFVALTLLEKRVILLEVFRERRWLESLRYVTTSAPWFLGFLALWLAYILLWRIEEWMEEESNAFLQLRDTLETLGVTYKRRRLQGTSPLRALSLFAECPDGNGGIQGYTSSTLLKDEVGTVGHEFFVLSLGSEGTLTLARKFLGLEKIGAGDGTSTPNGRT